MLELQIKKQEEEFDKIETIEKEYYTTEYVNKENAKLFIKKVRKETAKAVCDAMIKVEKKYYKDDKFIAGYKCRTGHEEEIKKQILKEL